MLEFWSSFMSAPPNMLTLDATLWREWSDGVALTGIRHNEERVGRGGGGGRKILEA